MATDIKNLKPKYGKFKQGYYTPLYPEKYKTNKRCKCKSWNIYKAKYFN